MSPTSFIRVRDLRFRYPGASHDALALSSLEIDRPGLVAITGPSGAGKSTLIELLAGTINERYSGSIEVLGQEWSELRTDRARQLHLRRIALIPQDLGLLPNQTPRQMLVQALLDAGVARSACDARVAQALAQMEITAHAERRIAELSGGQQQRVAIARALARNVDLILADEPTASLNAALVEEAVAVLRRIGLTVPIVMVTHDPAIAARCDRQIRLTAPPAVEAAPVLILPVATRAADAPTPSAFPAALPLRSAPPASRPVSPVSPIRPAGRVQPAPRSGVAVAAAAPAASAPAAPAGSSGAATRRFGTLAGLATGTRPLAAPRVSAAQPDPPARRVPHFGIVMSAAATGLVALVGVFAIGPLAPSASQHPAPAAATITSQSVPAPSPSPSAATPDVVSVVAPPAPSPSPADTHPVVTRAAARPATKPTTAAKVTTPPAPSPAAVVAPAPAPTPAMSAAPPATNALAWWVAMSQLLNTYGGGTNGSTGAPAPTPSPAPTAAHH